MRSAIAAGLANRGRRVYSKQKAMNSGRGRVYSKQKQ
jgi:hypothetical protein